MLKIRNLIIFLAIAAIFALIYIFVIKKAPAEPTLVATSALPDVNTGTLSEAGAPASGSSFKAQDFLALLLNVKNIKLNDGIFSDPAFLSLHDSSITLTPDGSEGRPNPFAPLGADTLPSPTPTPTGGTVPNSTNPNLNLPLPPKH